MLAGQPLIISGTPTESGDFEFTVRAQNTFGDFMDKTYAFSVVTILNDVLTEAELNVAYSFSLTIGGTTSGAVTWALVSGALPDGITLNTSTGLISGTPTIAGDYSFTIAFSDSKVSNCAKALTLTVGPGNIFQNIIWTNYGTFGIATGSALAENFDFDATSVMGVTSSGIEVPFGPPNAGSFLYTGDAINCRLTVNITGLIGPCGLDIEVYQDSVLVLDTASAYVLGENVYPFSLLAGTNSLIEIGTSGAILVIANASGDDHIAGTGLFEGPI